MKTNPLSYINASQLVSDGISNFFRKCHMREKMMEENSDIELIMWTNIYTVYPVKM